MQTQSTTSQPFHGFSNEPLYYYMLSSGLDGFAPRNEVEAMKDKTFTRPATLDETEDWMNFTTLNPWLNVAVA